VKDDRLTAVLRIIASILLLLAAGAGGAGIAATVDDDPTVVRVGPTGPTGPVPVPAVIGVDTAADRDVVADQTIRLTKDAREVAQTLAADPARFDLDSDGLRGQVTGPIAQAPGPLATPHVPGCKTRILPTNWSARNEGVEGFGMHYTAGPNRPGYADMDGYTAYASSPSAGVSWHFLIDAEGHCYYSVPIGQKAWTIGGLNSDLVNVENIGTGHEPAYLTPAALRKNAIVIRYVSKVYGFPVALGSVSNCEVIRPGIVTHWMGGVCAGGHVDIKPYDIAQVVRQVAAEIRRLSVVPLSDRDRTTCQKIHAYRAGDRHDARRQVKRRAFIKNRGHQCVHGRARQRTS
jgi:hypothetical protein